jgi:hypothetical protein
VSKTPTDDAASREPAAIKRPRLGGRRLVADLLVFAAIAVAGYFALARYLPRATHESPEEAADHQQQELDEWQRTSQGWERLFESSCQSWPGYIVDVGRPARLKLVQIGQPVQAMMLRKLQSPNYSERISAIYVLAEIGEPREHIEQLLEQELATAQERKHEVGALKCASVLSDNEALVIHLSLLALDSRHPRTREIALGYLFVLRDSAAAPADVTQRMLALLHDPDEKLRVRTAVYLTEEGAPESYRALLEGLSSTRNDVLLLAANHVAALRGAGRIDPLRSTQKEIDQALEGHRRWLMEKLE